MYLSQITKRIFLKLQKGFVSNHKTHFSGEVDVSQAKSKRGGKALRRIKTFLRREKKYVVVEGEQSSQRSRTR